MDLTASKNPGDIPVLWHLLAPNDPSCFARAKEAFKRGYTK